jgi:hypothetical protein
MTTVTGLTAARMEAIEGASVVDGEVIGDDLILTKFDTTTINAGNVRGPAGVTGGHCCRLTHNANQNVVSGTPKVLDFNTEAYDTDTMHDPATNPSRITCKTAGKYALSACAIFDATAFAGIRRLYFQLNGSTYIAVSGEEGTVGKYSILSIATDYLLAVNNWVELVAEVSGGNGAIVAAGAYSPVFCAHQIG